MPRPTKWRRVDFMPEVTYFRPAGIPPRSIEEVCLSVEIRWHVPGAIVPVFSPSSRAAWVLVAAVGGGVASEEGDPGRKRTATGGGEKDARKRLVWLGLAQRGRIRQRQGLRQRQSLFFLPFLSLAAKTVVGNALWRSVWSEHPFYGIWLPILPCH